MENVGLVLEGGGMRGLYTCGVLEFFMEKDLYFNYIIGVSAGACNAVSYIARQKGRNKKVNLQFTKDWRYMSFRNLLLKKSFFGMDFIFEEIPRKYVPFDFETFHKATCRFLVGTTDCNTGKPVYLNKEDLTEGFYALRATSSLPFISPIVDFKGYELLDGGISDSIPIVKSMEDGNTKNIIILTRNKEYRKSPMKYTNLAKLKYKKYPLLIKTMTDRYRSYNKTLEYIEQLESEGKVLVIRPLQELKVGRLEKNTEKLRVLFESGYEDAKNYYDKIMEFVSNKTNE